MMLKKSRCGVIILIVLLAMSVGIVSAAEMSQDKDVQIRLIASDHVADAQFGRSVDITGDLVAVGQGGDGAVGAVYLFRRQGKTYIQEAKLVSPDAAQGDTPEFGRTVSIQGNRVFIGARFAQVGDLKRAGAVYVFRKHGNKWQYEEKIVSPSPEDEDNFGRALAIQDDRMVVTARKSSLEEGAAYVFTYKDGSWVHQTDLVASDPTPGAYFGQSVALKGDLIVIGARNANPNGAGAVYVFKKARNGWNQIAKVTPSDGAKNDQYAFTIAISGNLMSVGSRRADLTGAADAGAVYVYSLKGDSVTLITKLTASDASAGDEFGQAITFAGDVMAVGAWKDDINNNIDQGSIYLFRRAGSKWIESGKIIASNGVAGDEFGYSLAAAGNRMVTGAHFADAKAGAAYVLTLKS